MDLIIIPSLTVVFVLLLSLAIYLNDKLTKSKASCMVAEIDKQYADYLTKISNDYSKLICKNVDLKVDYNQCVEELRLTIAKNKKLEDENIGRTDQVNKLKEKNSYLNNRVLFWRERCIRANIALMKEKKK